jgi:hypothetical protein
VRWKAGDIVIGIVAGEFIQHQKRIEPRQLRLTEGAAQAYAGAITGVDARNHAAHGALGHHCSPANLAAR